MKKIFLILPIIAVIALTGCFNKTVQQNQSLGQNATSTIQATTTKDQIDTYGDAKLFGSKYFGWEIKFTEPYQKIDCPECIGGMYLLFGPLRPAMSVELTTEKVPAYDLNFTEAKSIKNEFDIIKANATMPETVTQKKINGFDVIIWKDGGECENRMLEVFGAKYNIVMSSLGCATTEKEDFNYFENIAKTIKKLD